MKRVIDTSIANESQYESALLRIFRLMHEKIRNSNSEKKELEKLQTLVDAYEMKYYPLVSAL
jgi:antitoxin component HigA of HigAB toxin-antitoxin module